MRIRKQKRSRLLYMDDVLIGEELGTLELPDSRPSPEEILASSEVSEVLKIEIRRIPPLLRNIFVLRDIQRLSMSEAADELGISVAAAKSRLLRARKELRVRMNRHTGRLGAATLFAGA